ncbi:UvrD-helicase domain-containing protein [Natronomonas sp. F2-12]|uniref:DNA 3'-5' helicase n=1 Tax=Natronomonas aquatica TaxID=2841590 RepID=A0A9R1CT88_9EURY|nr:UvrD-helicase domain-containing protein [Natronomonas aquatica]MCQ4334928.1 UvrD-helicase domain-containing protein [Natronomonas aquatica]
MVSYEDLTDEQQRAVDALDRNVTLTAGAGTGKTTTLTARYLRMIEKSLEMAPDGGQGSDVLLPENILTTTFTERAANELEESVRGEITDRISSLEADEFEAWRTVADELEHGYIHTLHGFCARLLREHALSVDGLDPGFDTLDENETTALIHDTVGTVLEEHENHDAIRTLARRFSRSQLQDVLTDLVNERPESIDWAERWVDASEDEYLRFIESELHPIDPDEAAERLAQPEFTEALTTLRELVENPPDISTEGTAWKRAVSVVELLGDDFDDGVPNRRKQTTISKLSIHLTKGSGERYADYTGAKTHWGDNPWKDEFDTAIEQLVETLQPEEYAVSIDPELEAKSFPLVSALAEVTLLTVEEYEARKRSQNAADFSDLITYAVEFLNDEANEHIRTELREQFDYVMLDEFQDTDPRQWDLIKLLAATEKNTFDARNVFVVGDVKQSIYRFRNADVTQFKEIAETLEETGPSTDRADDQLSTNFRTLPTVLESINELFATVFDEDGEPYEAPPQRLTAAREDPADIGSAEYLFVPTDSELREARFDHYEEFADAEPESDAELEAMALAARLSQVLAEPYQVYPEDSEFDDETPEPRDIEPNDIAILIRSRTHLKAYERALDEANVPYSVASGIGFYETTEITALLNLFRALADPQDERALYAVLRSPLFGFTDDTLAQLKIHDETLWDALATTDAEELTAAHELLCKWRRRAGLGDDGTVGFDGSWAAFLTEILEDTGYLVNVSAGDRSQQAMANVEKFREQLRGWSDDGVRSLTTLVDRIERRVELGGRESEAETTGEGVQILTIHDSKGMEFPFVVVPELSRGFKDDASLGGGKVEFERVGDEHAVGMKAPSPDDPFEMKDTIARETVRERRRQEERAEEKRVLYVACTRARDHLLLCGHHELADDAEELSLAAIADADPESASSWRDWVQPALLPDEVCSKLDSEITSTRSYGKGSYRVSLPTPRVELEPDSRDVDPTIELSPDPPERDITFRLSATDLAALLGGYGELEVDEETRTAFVEKAEDSPDDRHGEDDLAGQGSESDPDHEQESTTGEAGIDPRVFGEMVHRICELRPPESRWLNLMEQTLVDEDATVELTDELQRRVSEHAQRGIEFVDEQTAKVEVDQQYDELYVTAEFDRGEIAGYIDHLIVSDEAYHIIDYKTGAVTPEAIEEDAEYYQNQMKAYAVALNQQQTDRPVRVSLVFTEIDEAWEIEWSTMEIESMTENLESDLLTRIS